MTAVAPPLIAAFRMKPRGFRSHVVKLFAKVPVHVELVFADGQAFRCVPGAPCQYVPVVRAQEPALGPYAGDADWRLLDLTPLVLDAAAARRSCDGMDGQPYDLLRAVVGWWAGLDTIGKPICCEAVADALVAAGAPPALRGRPSTTPRRLLVALEQLLADARHDARHDAHAAPGRAAGPSVLRLEVTP